MASEMASDIDHLSNEIKRRIPAALHCSRIETLGADPTAHHLGLVPTQMARRLERETSESIDELFAHRTAQFGPLSVYGVIVP